jgi:hypothetical protein
MPTAFVTSTNWGWPAKVGSPISINKAKAVNTVLMRFSLEEIAPINNPVDES